jgi:hypothetical protein
MAHADLNALIVANLKDLDAVACHLQQTLQPAVGDAMDEILEEHRIKAGWEGHADWDVDGAWLAPKDWRKKAGSAGDEFLCRFSLEADSEAEDDKDGYWLSQLLGLGHAKLGFRWGRKNVSKVRWRTIVGANTSIIGDLRGEGFSYDENNGSFFLPVILNPSEMSEALAQETAQLALGPLQNALDTLVRAKPKFDELLRVAAEME